MKKQFIKITKPAPVLNHPHFKDVFGGNDGKTLATDHKGHIRAIEYIALKGHVFEVINKCQEHILKVSSSSYLFSPLYIDERFSRPTTTDTVSTACPPIHIILSRMKKCLGLPYIWGGNWSRGIAELLQYYPPKTDLPKHMHNHWILKGVDCSGLLYEATNGYTPRNTSDLFQFGNFLTIEKNEIEKIVRPLDIILFPGHVIIIINQQTCIESKERHGVVLSNLKTRLKEIQQKKIPLNNCPFEKNISDFFVIKRWIK